MRDVSESGAWGRRRAHALALFFFAITVVKSCRRQKTHVPQANLHARTAWCRQLFHRPGHNKVRIVGDTVARKRWCLIKQCREGISLPSTTGRHTNGQYLHHGDLSSKLVHQLRGNSRVGCPPQYSSAQQSTRIDAVGGAVPELQTWAAMIKEPVSKDGGVTQKESTQRFVCQWVPGIELLNCVNSLQKDDGNRTLRGQASTELQNRLPQRLQAKMLLAHHHHLLRLRHGADHRRVAKRGCRRHVPLLHWAQQQHLRRPKAAFQLPLLAYPSRGQLKRIHLAVQRLRAAAPPRSDVCVRVGGGQQQPQCWRKVVGTIQDVTADPV